MTAVRVHTWDNMREKRFLKVLLQVEYLTKELESSVTVTDMQNEAFDRICGKIAACLAHLVGTIKQ